MFVVGAAFALLRLTGQIDAPGRSLAMRALDVLDSWYESPAEITRIREDLASFRSALPTTGAMNQNCRMLSSRQPSSASSLDSLRIA